MSNKRKIIFKEALFNVPFLLIISAATLLMMLLSGRSAYDIEQLVKLNMHSDPAVSINSFLTTESKSYETVYYYGDKDSSVKYAEFEYKGKGDAPESVLTLYEARDGFEAGVYSLVWFYDEQFVTYTPPGSDSFEKYSASENPQMCGLVESYAWESAMAQSGAADGMQSGYKLMGLRLFIWNSGDRECFLWTIGGNPRELYSYILGTQGEYKKTVFK